MPWKRGKHRTRARRAVRGSFGAAEPRRIKPAAPRAQLSIGLTPGALRQRIVPVGNAAGEGARRALINRAAWRAGETLARHTEFLELATMPQFQDEFVDQLAFPES